MNDNKYLTVSVLTQYLKHKFDTDEHLRCVFIKGELSNFKSHTSGHLYFSVKDENSKINAIMFSNNAKKLTFKPIDGTKVLIMGRVSVYEATGNYQIYVEKMLEDGVGNLYIAFEKLKEQLSKEGLFNPEHKLQVPKMPHKIGVITAPTGAAIKDIISTLKRRFPICEVILFPSLVQGENAARDIVKNIERASNYNLDLLIVGRGGGSIEDLWPFNEEIVARAIYNCQIPTISAVGHEIDYTIADFVADLRAPTPTGAAEMAVPNINDVIRHLEQLKIRANESLFKNINYKKLMLDAIKNSFVLKNPLILYENKKQRLDMYFEKMESILKFKLGDAKNKYSIILDKLELLNPINTLKRGYSVTYLSGRVITDVKKLKEKDEVNIKLSNGNILAEVKKIVEE